MYSRPKCPSPCIPIAIEKSNIKIISLYESNFFIELKCKYKNIEANKNNNPFSK